MLSRLVITFPPRSKSLNFMAEITICSYFGAPQNKVCYCFHCFPSICKEVMGPGAMILVFWMLNVKQFFSLSSFTFIKKPFRSSSFSAIGWCHLYIWGYWYFFPAILIPACVSSSPAFLMMNSAWCTPFPVCNQCVVPCPVLSVPSWPA